MGLAVHTVPAEQVAATSLLFMETEGVSSFLEYPPQQYSLLLALTTFQPFPPDTPFTPTTQAGTFGPVDPEVNADAGCRAPGAGLVETGKAVHCGSTLVRNGPHAALALARVLQKADVQTEQEATSTPDAGAIVTSRANPGREQKH